MKWPTGRATGAPLQVQSRLQNKDSSGLVDDLSGGAPPDTTVPEGTLSIHCRQPFVNESHGGRRHQGPQCRRVGHRGPSRGTVLTGQGHREADDHLKCLGRTHEVGQGLQIRVVRSGQVRGGPPQRLHGRGENAIWVAAGHSDPHRPHVDTHSHAAAHHPASSPTRHCTASRAWPT